MTAVQQLIEQLIKYELVPKGTHPDNVLFHKAIEEEKQQIIDAFKHGRLPVLFGELTSEQYYNETFKPELTSQLPGINVNDVKPSNPQMVKDIF